MSDPFEGAEGVIDTFNPDDSIGVLRLDDGREVRFGASACDNFLPVVGARIRLDEVRSNARGVKARRVSLLDQAKAHHDRAAKTYGLQRPSLTEQRNTAAMFGWVTVLLDAALPETQAELDALGRKIGLEGHGMGLVRDASGDVNLRGRGPSIRVYPVAAPIDDRQLALDQVGADFPRGSAHVSLSLGMPEVARKLRQLNPEHGQQGIVDLGRAALALSQLGPGVVLDLAEGLVLSSAEFARLLDGPDPLQPWTAFSSGHEDLYLRTRGMGYLNAPELAMAMLPTGMDDTAAILAALGQDMAQGWQPQAGEVVAFSLAERELSFQLAELSAGWWLGTDQGEDGFLAHHAGMWLAAAERLHMRRIGYLRSDNQYAPAHYVDIFTGLGTAMITNGVSLALQPGGNAEDGNERVELMCYLDRHGPAQARLLSMFAGMMFSQRGDQPFRAWDGLRNGPDSGLPDELAQLILVPRDPISVWPGHAPQLFQIVAVAADEYAQLRAQPEAGARWLQARNQAGDWKRYHLRFNALSP